jgi:Trypsin-co-occurring domain 1
MSEDSNEPTLSIAFGRPGANPYAGKAADLAAAAAREALPALADAIAPAARAFWERIEGANLRPKEVELEMSVVLEGKTNWMVVAGGEAAIKVTLKW